MATNTKYSAESTEKLIANLKKYKEGVAWCQSKIEKYKECSDNKGRYESKIREFKSFITDDNNSIQEIKLELSTRPVNLDEIMEDMVDRKETTSLVGGGGGVGKTHLTALLTKQPPPTIRVSTPCANIPSWLLKHLQVQKSLSGLVLLTEEMHTAQMIAFGSSTKSDLVQKLGSKSSIPSPPNSQFSDGSAIKKSNSTVDEVKVHFLISKELTKKFKKTKGQIFGRIVDIGGQPQLLELLPRFVSNITLGAVVIDLSQGLDKYPISYFYGEDGRPVGRGIRSNLTNEQIVRVFLLMIASLCTEQKKVKIIIIGTHRDVEWKCWESRQTKENKMKAIISSFNLEKNVIYMTKSSLIFDVNAKRPENRDRQTAEKIMELMMCEEYSVKVSIPIKHHKLELTAQTLSGSHKIAVSFDELYSKMDCNYDSPEAMTEGLEFLNKSFRLFYFKEIPELVFGVPQRLLNLMTEITVYHIKLTTNPDQRATCDGMWNEFKEQAIVTEEILEKISKCYDNEFTAKQMLEVMEKLSITCKLQEGKYLMPSLLTALAALPQMRSSRWKWLPFGLGNYLQKLISGMKSDITLLVHFPNGLSRFGVFCGTVCKLISDYKWELFGEISRNRLQLTQPNNIGIVSFIDSFDSFYIVNLDKIPSDFSSDKLASLCSKTCQIIFNAIMQVTANLGYKAKDPEIAFLCDHDTSFPHVAEYLHEDNRLRCIKNKQYTKPLTSKNELWLQMNSTGHKEFLILSEATHSSSTGDLPLSEDINTQDLSKFEISMNKLSLLKWTDGEQKACQLRLIEEISPDWKKASDLLGLTTSHTRRIEMNNQTVESRCREVMAEWLSNEDGAYQYPRSWEGLYQLLEDMRHSSLAENLREVIDLLKEESI